MKKEHQHKAILDIKKIPLAREELVIIYFWEKEIYRGFQGYIKFRISNTNIRKNTRTYKATINEAREVVKKLVYSGYDVELKDEYGKNI